MWVSGLQPDTEHRYRVTIDGRQWAAGKLRDWLDGEDGPDLVETDDVYHTRFRTFPSPDVAAPLRFAVMGDYGVGILASGGTGDRQRRLGAALERAVDPRRRADDHRRQHLPRRARTVAGTGNHDDDWYFSFYEPYRYTISRVPVYPGVGNHDTSDTEISDNRDQLADNLFTDLRFGGGAEVDRASVDPGLFYRFSYGSDVHFVAIDSTLASDLEYEHFVDHPRHRNFLERQLVTERPPGWIGRQGPRGAAGPVRRRGHRVVGGRRALPHRRPRVGARDDPPCDRRRGRRHLRVPAAPYPGGRPRNDADRDRALSVDRRMP